MLTLNKIDALYKQKKYDEAQAAEDEMYKETDEWVKKHSVPKKSSKEMYDSESNWSKYKLEQFEHEQAKNATSDIDRTPDINIDPGDTASQDSSGGVLLSDIDKKAPVVAPADEIQSSTLPIVKKHQWAPMPKAYKKKYKIKYKKYKAPPMHHFAPAPYRAPATINCS